MLWERRRGGVLSLGKLFGKGDPEGNGNTAWGYHTSYSTEYNDNTTAVGYEALYTNRTDENTAVGAYALHDNTEGKDLTAVGFKALENNIGLRLGDFGVLGYANTAVGAFSQKYNLEGFNNTSIGASALKYNLVGFSNTAAGSLALYVNQSSWNTAMGDSSMLTNTVGAFNTAAGGSSLLLSTAGYYNDSTGYSSMSVAVAPFYNVADGVIALSSVLFPMRNVAIGYNSMGGQPTSILNPITYAPVYSFSDNVAVGFNAMPSNRESANVAVGSEALLSNIYGRRLVGVGYQALWNNIGGEITIQGEYNTAVGYQALYDNRTGYENTAIGAYSLVGQLTGASSAIGFGSKNTLLGAFSYIDGGDCNVCIGDRANDYGFYDVIIGQDAQNDIDIFLKKSPATAQCVVIGCQAYTAGKDNTDLNVENNVAIGYKTYTRDNQTVAVGYYNRVNGVGSTAVGSYAMIYGTDGVAIGNYSYIDVPIPGVDQPVEAQFSTAVGQSSLCIGKYNTSIGADAQIKGTCNTCLGFYSSGQNTTKAKAGYSNIKAINGNTFLGAYSGGTSGKAFLSLVGDYNIAVGYGSQIVGQQNQNYNIAIGTYSQSVGTSNAVAIGPYAYAKDDRTVAIGYYAQAEDGFAIAIGDSSQCDAGQSIAIGDSSKITGGPNGSGAIAIGPDSEVKQSANAIAIGRQAEVNGANDAIAIGPGARASSKSAIAIGKNANADGQADIIIGGTTQGIPKLHKIWIGAKNLGAAPAPPLGGPLGDEVRALPVIPVGGGEDGTVIIGDMVTHPPETGFQIFGLKAGNAAAEFGNVGWDPGTGNLYFGPCPVCVAAGPLEGDLDIEDDEWVLRAIKDNGSDKLLALQPLLKRGMTRSCNDEEIVTERWVLRTPEDPLEFCPQLLTQDYFGQYHNSFQLDKTFIAMLQIVKRHEAAIMEQQEIMEVQQNEIDELHKEIKELKAQMIRGKKV